MKHLIPAILALLVISAAPDKEADPQHHIKVTKLDYQIEKTPEYNVDVDRERKSDPRSWLSIEAEIDAETIAPNKFIPELTATWHVVMNNAFEPNPNKPAVRLKGSITYQHLNTRAGKIRLIAYLHPDTLQMLTGKENARETDIRSVAIEITGPDLSLIKNRKQGHSLAIGENDDHRWWENWQSKTIDKAILPLTKTPFLPIWADHYPQVKAE